VPKLTRHTQFETRDVDEASAHLQRLLHQRLEVLGREKFHFCMQTATLQAIAVSTVQSAAGMEARILGDPLVYTLLRQESGLWDRKADGGPANRIHPAQGILVPPSSIATSRLPATFETTMVSIPVGLIQLEAEHLIGERPKQPIELIEINNLGPASFLGQNLNFILEQLELENGLFEKYDLRGFQAQRLLVSTLIEMLPHNYQGLLAKHHGGTARRHVARAEEYIEAHLHGVITVGDMAAAVGISARTLRDSCQRVREQTPEVLLRRARLYAAHNRLENPKPTDTVTSVAREFLFTNTGRFAEYYQQQFHGETPAQTLRRGRRKHS
jgi:AraC-like DNA-binding protein